MKYDTVISGCGLYRYWLTRVLSPRQKLCVFVLLNPSTADGTLDDPTIRRCCGYATRFECGRLLVVNLFAYRATDRRELKKVANPIGPLNHHYLYDACLAVHTQGGLLICGWGNDGAFMNQHSTALTIFKQSFVQPYCLNLTATGQPGHPLYLKLDAPLIEYGGSV